MKIKGKKNIIAMFVACISLGVIPGVASATFLTGGIGMGGVWTATGGAGVDLSDATGLDVSFSVATTASGDFAPAAGLTVNWNHLDFNPANTPVTPLWTTAGGGYSFDLMSVVVTAQDANTLNLSGMGVLMAAGFEDTMGSWTFSGNSGSSLFTFSSIAAADQVPEPATLLLMAGGLLGFAASRRRRA